MILPAVGMSLSTSTALQQLWIVIWQFFPILVSVAQILLSHTFYFVNVHGQDGSPEKRVNVQAHLALKKVYDFATAVASVAHVITLMIAFTNQFFPSVFPPAYHGLFHASKILLPRLSGRRPIYSIAEGAMMFMQWDETISLLAMLLWSLCLLFAVVPVENKSNGLKFAGGALAKIILIGPAATIVNIVRSSDLVALEIVPDL